MSIELMTTRYRFSQEESLKISPENSRGMTLVEMLVAMTASLIMMALVAQIMAMFGRGMNGSRKQAEIYDRLRAATERLKQDLAGLTVEFCPPISPEKGLGYFEYIEGPGSDRWQCTNFQNNSSLSRKFDRLGETAITATAELGSDDRLLSDVDDVLLFTTRSTDSQFIGILDNGGLRSPCSEVVWYCRHIPGSSNPSMFNLYRRQLLVVGHPTRAQAGAGSSGGTFSNPAFPNLEPFVASQPPSNDKILHASAWAVWENDWNNLLERSDVSCRIQNGYATPNTLGDLTKRENRFCRLVEFPFSFDQSSDYLSFPPDTPRQGQDIILTNCIGFDVRVLDERTPLRRAGTILLAPDDPGYASAVSVATTVPTYVDLNYEGAGNTVDDDSDTLTDEYDEIELPRSIGQPVWHRGSPFETPGVEVGTNVALVPSTYDTWSTHYETNGFDDDVDGLIDEGHDRVDTNSNTRIDESLEAETSPPYPVPIRAIEVRVRCYEPYSKRVLQITIRQSL